MAVDDADFDVADVDDFCFWEIGVFVEISFCEVAIGLGWGKGVEPVNCFLIAGVAWADDVLDFAGDEKFFVFFWDFDLSVGYVKVSDYENELELDIFLPLPFSWQQ